MQTCLGDKHFLFLIKETLIEKNIRAGAVAQSQQYSPRIHKALGSVPSTGMGGGRWR